MEQWALSQRGSCMLDVTAGSYPTRGEDTSQEGNGVRKDQEWKEKTELLKAQLGSVRTKDI